MARGAEDGGAIDRAARIVRSREPVSVDVDGSVVMMSILRGKYYGLDAVGTRVWELIEEPRSVTDLCRTLEEEFEVDEATCLSDVLDFVRALAAEGLIDVLPPASA